MLDNIKIPQNWGFIEKMKGERMEKKSYIKQVANMLGVEINEEFKIKPTEYAKVLGHKENDNIFRFDTELVYKGYNDGWSEWYGFGCDRVLYHLILGLYEIVKLNEEGENTNE